MIQKLGGSVELVDVGKQPPSDGSEIPLPPVLLGQLGNDPDKKMVLMYGHLDVQPALKVRLKRVLLHFKLHPIIFCVLYTRIKYV